MKSVVLICGCGLVLLNVLTAVLLPVYGMPAAAWVTFSLILSTLLVLHIHSGPYADAYRVVLVSLACGTGLVRVGLCMAPSKGMIQGLAILGAVALCLVEAVALALARMASRKR